MDGAKNRPHFTFPVDWSNVPLLLMLDTVQPDGGRSSAATTEVPGGGSRIIVTVTVSPGKTESGKSRTAPEPSAAEVRSAKAPMARMFFPRAATCDSTLDGHRRIGAIH